MRLNEVEIFEIFTKTFQTRPIFFFSITHTVFKILIDFSPFFLTFEYLFILLFSQILGFWWAWKSSIDFPTYHNLCFILLLMLHHTGLRLHSLERTSIGQSETWNETAQSTIFYPSEVKVHFFEFFDHFWTFKFSVRTYITISRKDIRIPWNVFQSIGRTISQWLSSKKDRYPRWFLDFDRYQIFPLFSKYLIFARIFRYITYE